MEININMEKYNNKWKLNNIYSSVDNYSEFKLRLEAINKEINLFHKKIEQINSTEKLSPEKFSELIIVVEKTSSNVLECISYTGCLVAQDTKDEEAMQLQTIVNELSIQLSLIAKPFENILARMSNEDWANLFETESLNKYYFVLNEKRNELRKLNLDNKELIEEFSIEGFHGWSRLYSIIANNVKIPINQDNEYTPKENTENSILNNKQEDERRKALKRIQDAWNFYIFEFCECLNNIAGFRINIYIQQERALIIDEALEKNRMSEVTLNNLWSTLKDHTKPFVDYFERKSQILGKKKLDWFDLQTVVGASNDDYSFNEAANLIIESFSSVSSTMGNFAEEVFSNRWIDAEIRDSKVKGSFCTSFPNQKETRILTTYTGKLKDVYTLAHELGHSFHQHVLDQQPFMLQHPPIVLSEVASTFAELIISEKIISQELNIERKISLLDNKIQQSINFLIEIYARYLFETKFYNQRMDGPLQVRDVNKIMLEAQEEAYLHMLESYDPTTWATKQHFFNTQVPFYNFPYSVGYTISLGIYSDVLSGNFNEVSLLNFLKNSGNMSVEESVSKFFNYDLSKDRFWKSAFKIVTRDINQFLYITKFQKI